MKSYIILALLVGYSLQQGCQKFTCGTLTDQCVGKSLQTDASVTVQNCASGSVCSGVAFALDQAGYNQLVGLSQAAGLTCATVDPTPTPTPAGSIQPGDTCAADADCRQGAGGAVFKCTSKACSSTTQVADAVCATNSDCNVGFYCNALKCAAVVAPGGTCTPGATATSLVPQCGYNSYCLSNGATPPVSVCVPLYSQANGFAIPAGVQMPQICKSGYQGTSDG